MNNVTIRALHVLAFSEYPTCELAPHNTFEEMERTTSARQGRTRRWPVFHVMVWYMQRQGSLSLTMLLIASSYSSGRAKAPHLTHTPCKSTRATCSWPMTIQDNHPTTLEWKEGGPRRRSHGGRRAQKRLADHPPTFMEYPSPSRNFNGYTIGPPLVPVKFKIRETTTTCSNLNMSWSAPKHYSWGWVHPTINYNYMICFGGFGGEHTFTSYRAKAADAHETATEYQLPSAASTCRIQHHY